VIWLTWRQQRTESGFAIAGLVVVAAYVVWAGLKVASAYTHYGVATCRHLVTNACFDKTDAFANGSRLLGGGRSFSISILLGLIGIGLAMPVVSELSSGAATFSWTQGVTRARWLRPKLALAGLMAILVGAGVTLLDSWARGPLNTVTSRYTHDAFDLQGIVPVAYCLFALGLGLFFGVLIRRTAPAAVVAVVTWGATRVFVDNWLRKRLVTPTTVNYPPTADGPNNPGDWFIAGGYSNRAGVVSHATEAQVGHCTTFMSDSHVSRCLAKLGASYNHAVYFPPSRFWDFQVVESSLFVGATLLLIAFAAWRVLRTD
jgi:hypothetical protein